MAEPLRELVARPRWKRQFPAQYAGHKKQIRETMSAFHLAGTGVENYENKHCRN